MSRSTQFIGLTKAAEDFVAGLEYTYEGHAEGMFNEEIPLRKWPYPTTVHPQRQKDACVREIVQTTASSSGIMIFTCLEIDYGNGFKQKCFQWIDDPTIDCEYDTELGRLWV